MEFSDTTESHLRSLDRTWKTQCYAEDWPELKRALEYFEFNFNIQKITLPHPSTNEFFKGHHDEDFVIVRIGV